MKLIKPSYEIIENYEVNGDKLTITKKKSWKTSLRNIENLDMAITI